MSSILAADGKSADTLNASKINNQEDFSDKDCSSSDLENDFSETEVNSVNHFNYITTKYVYYTF